MCKVCLYICKQTYNSLKTQSDTKGNIARDTISGCHKCFSSVQCLLCLVVYFLTVLLYQLAQFRQTCQFNRHLRLLSYILSAVSTRHVPKIIFNGGKYRRQLKYLQPSTGFSGDFVQVHWENSKLELTCKIKST